MTPDDLYNEIHSLQLEIEENEKNFDAALQDTPSQVELARTIYKYIKVMEARLSDLRILFDQISNGS
ncbi:MAG: hypothetical protein WDM78_13520 [Puia sp.]